MEKKIGKLEISNYYDTFCEEERNLRLNLRHYTIFYHLLKSGLKKDHHVLEIGSGFGTVTYLMGKYLTRGSILATDISAERIASCKRQFKNNRNISFLLTDIMDLTTEDTFDYIILPDVLEHIPFTFHQAK